MPVTAYERTLMGRLLTMKEHAPRDRTMRAAQALGLSQTSISKAVSGTLTVLHPTRVVSWAWWFGFTADELLRGWEGEEEGAPPPSVALPIAERGHPYFEAWVSHRHDRARVDKLERSYQGALDELRDRLRGNLVAIRGDKHQRVWAQEVQEATGLDVHQSTVSRYEGGTTGMNRVPMAYVEACATMAGRQPWELVLDELGGAHE